MVKVLFSKILDTHLSLPLAWASIKDVKSFFYFFMYIFHTNMPSIFDEIFVPPQILYGWFPTWLICNSFRVSGFSKEMLPFIICNNQWRQEWKLFKSQITKMIKFSYVFLGLDQISQWGNHLLRVLYCKQDIIKIVKVS